MELVVIAHIIVSGFVGTLIFDFWNWFLQRSFAIRAPNWAILGKWLLAPFTSSQSTTPTFPEFSATQRVLGTIAHYLTGITFAASIVLVAGREWLDRPTLLPAFMIGVVTVLFDWFIIMPALGHGIAGAKTPIAKKIRVVSLISHGVLGLGFYLGALIASFGASIGLLR